MSDKIRVGIIGAGGIAMKLHLPELVAEDDCEVVLLSGRRESRLKKLCETFDVPRFTTRYEDVVADDGLDAVLVATPHPQHVPWGLKVLEAGRHLLMQKPLCADLAEADRFVDAVDRTDRSVLCLPHFKPSAYHVRELIRDGQLGRVVSARMRTSHGGPEVYYREVASFFGEPAPEGRLWFFDRREAGVGALFDMGVYAVAHLVAMLGTIREVTAVAPTIAKPTDLEDHAVVIMHADSGAVAVAETSWCDPARTWEFSVHGTQAKVVAPTPGLGDDPLVQFIAEDQTSDQAPVRRVALDPGAGVGNAHRHWLDCIREGIQPPVSNARCARHVTEVMLAALASAASRQPVTLHTTID